MRTGIQIHSVLASTLLLFAAACGGNGVRPASPVAPANSEVATSLVIDQFLRAANSNDLDTMARLFGTADGSILKWEDKKNVESRMFAVASVLRHETYAIKREEIVPGRRDQATRIIVGMTFSDGKAVDVPYTLVYTRDNIWIVEQIGITEITNRR